MEKKDKAKSSKLDRDIIGAIKGFNKSISDLSYKINGSDDNIIPDSLDDKLNNLSNELEINCNGDILGSLINIARTNKMDEAKKLEEIKNTIKDNTNGNIMQTLINDMNSLIAKYEDLMLVTSIMPQLKDARKGIVNNILSPDDVTKKVSLKFSLNGNENSINNNNNKEFFNEVKDIMDKVKFTKILKHGIDRTVVLGKYYYAVLPYSELYGQMINKNKVKYNKLKENTNNINSDFELINEDAIKDVLSPSTNIKNLKSSMVDFVDANVTINEGSIGLFDQDVLQEELKLIIEGTELSGADFSKYATDIMNKSNKKQKNYYDSGFISTNELNEKDIPNIKGCKIKKLDPRRLIPLKIDETCFGYYYIENKKSMKAIQNPLKFKLKTDLSRTQIDDSIDNIYKNIGKLMINKIDKKFIEKNNDIADRLYDIIKNYEYADQQYSITFLKPDDVVEFEIDDGESPFEQSLLFSKLYLLVLVSTITARVTRSNDIRAYYVDVDAKGPANNMLMNAINTLKRQNKSIIYYNNIQKIMASNTVFDDLFLPKPAEGKTPIDYDIIQGQNVDIPTDLLEMLEKIAVDSTGLPLQLIQSSNDADFAKAYSMLNIKFLKRIIDMQVDINPSVTLLLVKILLCYFEKDSDNYNKAKRLEVTLQSPINIQLSNSLEQINNAKDYANAISEIRLGTSERFTDELREDFVLEVVKKLTPNVDWVEIDNMIDGLLNKHVVTSIKASDDGSGDDMSGEDIDMNDL